MPRESARSLRHAVIAVGALGALSLSVPASLWLSPTDGFPALRPAGQTVTAGAIDDQGQPLESPTRLRPGSSTEIVVTGFAPGEPILLRHSGSTRTFSGGRADSHGTFRYRLTVPVSMSGAHFLTVTGGTGQNGLPAGSPGHTAVFRFVVTPERAGQ